jgi:predicted nucleic acid-binding protein
MGQRFLIDTNVVIDALDGTMPHNVRQKVNLIAPVVSAVTYMEALGGYQVTAAQIRIIHFFLEQATILPINQPVIEATVKLRQQKKIGLGDAIIAATAIVHNRVLVTRNDSDFKSIDNLIVFNPWK